MIVIIFTTCLVSLSSSELIVETSSGPVQSVSALTEDVEAFLGIPYAEPPTGDLRFAKPLPKKPWKEIYKASSLPNPCTQFIINSDYLKTDVTNMSEDCLYLNIWMPKADYGHRLRPIIFYIHPGGFAIGSSNSKTYDGSRLASRGDVVVVTINYRLGALGFLLAFIEEANGSMGIHDQVMALKWVKDNAKTFGGDPENIVLMGASAGAISVSLHIVFPYSKNLFNRAIIQSGSVIHPFNDAENARLFRNSESIAAGVGCSNKTFNLSSDPRLVVKCLREKPAKDLAHAEFLYLQGQPVMFTPKVEDAFLSRSVLELFRKIRRVVKKDIEVLTGISKDEGSIFLAGFLSEIHGKHRNRTMNRNLAVILGVTFAQVFGQPRANEMVKMFLKSVKDGTSYGYLKAVSDIISDCSVACSTVFYADLMSLLSKNVYFYKFEYRSPSTPLEEWMGTPHVYEIQYVFGNPYFGNFTEEEQEYSHRLMDRWSAFAKTGNPNIPNQLQWLPYSYKRPLYLSIDSEESLRLRPLDRCELWRKRFNAEIDENLLATIVDEDSTQN